MEKPLRIKDLSTRLGVDPTTVRAWLLAGKGPAHVRTPGGHFRFLDSDEVERWVQSLASQPPHPDAAPRQP
jgi:hypothetical protein